MNLLERNKDLARWFRDLRNRAEIGQVTPPPSIVDMIERLMEETAAEQLRGAVSDVTTARSLLHDFALDRGSTDGLRGVFDALNAALTRLGGQ